MTDHYQVTVVGGGPAGLTAALYTTRLGHDTAIINRGGGRAAMMLDTHNVIGVTEDVSGNEFLATATEQVQSYGADYFQDFVTDIEPTDEGYHVTAGNIEVTTDHVVLATGFSDERPDPPLPRTGKGLHWCLHCDAYMFVDQPVYVMGTGDSAAYVAMIMLNFTPDVDLLTRGEEPEWSEETATMLENHPVEVIHEEITGMEKREDGWLEGFEFEDGSYREYRGGFPMYGSNYNTDLAESLGVELNDDGTIAVDDHGRTNVDGVFAVGDVTPGHNQIPTAMGEGARCGIGNHYDLRKFPRSVEEIEAQGAVTEADVPGSSERLREKARNHESWPGIEKQATASDD
ncbi:SidA/IucD/PvdA family monooxygenase [Natronomonas sp. CBA1123]|jgi:thioredoxin reductase (NADPH)|uniref:NAD(P)/FAD-dependent oxidoreductase n=1 Tax=Natronomonas sp. CBA1123 TaxID=2668070 RepID=UPI0012E9DC50|nr:NAD(P)/FAD-dependent oxidoreductase [Natronomonas sp. CBA1123]MUV87574.1 SidA/IucD/PvdA family monooxygenase [Natronomonas sp. CBA1123]